MHKVGNVDVIELFDGDRLINWLRNAEQGILRKPDAFREDDLQGIEAEDKARWLLDQVVGQVPVLETDPSKISVGEAEEGSPRPGFHVLRYDVPFAGAPWIFRMSERNSPVTRRALIRGDHVWLFYETNGFDTEARAKQDIELINQVLTNLRNELKLWENGFFPKLKAAVQARKDHFAKRDAILASSSFPVRPRPGAPTAFEPPAVRRKVVPTLPSLTAPLEFDPVEHEAQYQHILELLSQMGRVAEMAPSSFRPFGEVALTWVLLMALNSHYEGDAKAEAFSKAGKTDIHIQHKGASIFVAECKIWKSPKKLTDAVTQLIGYVTLRDTKTALIVFNKSGEPTTRLKTIRTAIEAHPNFIRFEGEPSSTMQRYTMRVDGDAEKEFTMTMLLFEVPVGASQDSVDELSDDDLGQDG